MATQCGALIEFLLIHDTIKNKGGLRNQVLGRGNSEVVRMDDFKSLS